jgi:hypothetical protein
MQLMLLLMLPTACANTAHTAAAVAAATDTSAALPLLQAHCSLLLVMCSLEL